MRWVFIFFPLFVFPHTLVFVHLGKNIPECLFASLKQAHYFNQDSEIYLLTDQKKAFYFDEKITVIDTALIPITEEHRTFQKINKMDPSISDGLWAYASERFFVLYDFIKERSLIELVHLESDCMLYMDLDELMPFFKGLRMAAPFQSLFGCIPCFVYIQDSQSLSLLLNHILSEIECYQGVRPHIYLNDMQTLASFYRKFGAAWMFPLPTLMPEYARKFPRRKSHFAQDNSTHLRFLSMNASFFTGYIFDAAGLAIYINGNDQRHTPGHGPATIHSRCLFNPGHFSYLWGKDSKGRAVPYLFFEGKSYQIVNLHFHSKMVEEYTSFKDFRRELCPWKLF